MSSDTGVARPLRRDAELNRARILDAARAEFAERGLDARLDHIAARAGVGVGTVYRRFPSKEHLVEALFEDRIAECADLAEAAAARPDAGPALVDLLASLAELHAGDRGLSEIMFGSPYRSERLDLSVARLNDAITLVIRQAQHDGALRVELRTTDIPVLLFALEALAEFGRPVDPQLWRRYLPMIIDGVRADPGHSPLEHPALDAAQLDVVMEAHHRRVHTQSGQR